MSLDDRPPGGRMVEAFHYVRDVYRNAAALLGSADILLDRYGLRPYTGWASLYMEPPKLNNVDTWLPERALRQYHRDGKRDAEVFSLVLAFWEQADPPLAEPLCLVSHMDVTTTSGTDVYWLAAAPMWLCEGIRTDGVARVVTRAVLKLDEWSAGRYDAIVKGDRILYTAAPLLDITDLTSLEERVVRPMVAALKAPTM